MSKTLKIVQGVVPQGAPFDPKMYATLNLPKIVFPKHHGMKLPKKVSAHAKEVQGIVPQGAPFTPKMSTTGITSSNRRDRATEIDAQIAVKKQLTDDITTMRLGESMSYEKKAKNYAPVIDSLNQLGLINFATSKDLPAGIAGAVAIKVQEWLASVPKDMQAARFPELMKNLAEFVSEAVRAGEIPANMVDDVLAAIRKHPGLASLSLVPPAPALPPPPAPGKKAPAAPAKAPPVGPPVAPPPVAPPPPGAPVLPPGAPAPPPGAPVLPPGAPVLPPGAPAPPPGAPVAPAAPVGRLALPIVFTTSRPVLVNERKALEELYSNQPYFERVKNDMGLMADPDGDVMNALAEELIYYRSNDNFNEILSIVKGLPVMVGSSGKPIEVINSTDRFKLNGNVFSIPKSGLNAGGDIIGNVFKFATTKIQVTRMAARTKDDRYIEAYVASSIVPLILDGGLFRALLLSPGGRVPMYMVELLTRAQSEQSAGNFNRFFNGIQWSPKNVRLSSHNDWTGGKEVDKFIKRVNSIGSFPGTDITGGMPSANAVAKRLDKMLAAGQISKKDYAKVMKTLQ